MRKYDGIVIHRSVDPTGVVEVVDHLGVRSLHFGTDPKQSSMRLADPIRLELPYIRAMTSALLFNPSPRRALIIGLGGGSLAKFLLHFFPECTIDAVESRERVVEVARTFFGLPDDPRLSVVIGDGAHYVRDFAARRGGEYDLVLVDAYDHMGMARSINGYRFTDACAALLAARGVLAINLWGTHPERLEQSMDSLCLTFDDQVLHLPVRGRGNIIAFAFSAGVKKSSLRALKDQAQTLEDRYGVEFPVFLRDLRRYNTSLVERLFA